MNPEPDGGSRYHFGKTRTPSSYNSNILGGIVKVMSHSWNDNRLRNQVHDITAFRIVLETVSTHIKAREKSLAPHWPTSIGVQPVE